MNAANLSGQITTPGFIETGIATGQLTLSGVSGSVTLTVKGPKENGFGPMPPRLTFSITSATGKYGGAKGNGHIVIRLDAASGTFTMKF